MPGGVSRRRYSLRRSCECASRGASARGSPLRQGMDQNDNRRRPGRGPLHRWRWIIYGRGGGYRTNDAVYPRSREAGLPFPDRRSGHHLRLANREGPFAALINFRAPFGANPNLQVRNCVQTKRRGMTFDQIVAAIQNRRFLPSKPIREIRPIDQERNPRILASRKYNGNFATAVVQPAGQVEFYTSSNLHLANLHNSPWFEDGEWRNALSEAKPGTIFLGELFIPSVGIEDLGAFQTWYSWHRNGTGESPRKAKFLSFDLLALAGKSFHQNPYEEPHQLIPSAMRVAAAPYTSLDQAEAALGASARIGCEGFVFWDAQAASLCKIGGQNKARGAAWKVKPI